MTEAATDRVQNSLAATAPWLPVDLKTLPGNCPRPRRECAQVINLWVERALRKDADQRQAISEFSRAIELDPSNPLGYFNRARSYQQLGEQDQAIKDYDEAIRLDPNSLEAYNNRGVAYYDQNKHSNALTNFEELLRRASTKASTNTSQRRLIANSLINKGSALAALNRSEEAIAVYDDVLRRFGTLPELALREVSAMALFNKGNELSAVNRGDEAIALYDDVAHRFGTAPELALRELSAMALLNKSGTLGALNRSEDAVDVYDELHRRFGNATEPALQRVVATALGNKAIVLGTDGLHEEEIAVYDDVVRGFGTATDPDLCYQVAKALLNKGLALDLLNRWEEAITVCDDLLRRFETRTEPALREQVAKVLVNKGAMLSALNRNEAAIAVYDDMLGRFGAATEPPLRQQIANAHFNKGADLIFIHRFKQASESFRAAVKINSGLALVVQRIIELALFDYYNLDLRDDIINNNGNDLPISAPKLHKIIRRTSAEIAQRLCAVEPAPFTPLTGKALSAFIAHARTHQWDDRKKHGWPYHTNAFKYLHVTYSQWIPGLTREHVAAADRSFHTHLTRKISLEGMPEWLDVPTGAEAKIRAITDPIERIKQEAVREYQRDQKRQTRARKARTPGG